MIKKKKKADFYYVLSNVDVEEGSRYLCIKDVKMGNGRTVFTKGKVYTSEAKNHLTNDEGNTRYRISGFGENSFLQVYFKLMIIS